MTSTRANPIPDCLWCGAPLPDVHGTGRVDDLTRCRVCGRGDRKDDLGTYHTLRPSSRRLQTALEVTSVLGLGACFFLCVKHWRHLKGGDPAIAYPIVGGMLTALALGYASRFITRRRPPGRPGCLHPVPLLGGLGAALLYAVFIGLGTTRLEGGPRIVVLGIAAIVVIEMAQRIRRALRSGRRRLR
ncbi:MAG: hypothetical protein AAFU73_16140 [Planctomycetota bacterium]